MKNRAFHNFQTFLLCLKRYPSFIVASRVVKMAMAEWSAIALRRNFKHNIWDDLQTTLPTGLKNSWIMYSLIWGRKEVNRAAPLIVSWLRFCYKQTEVAVIYITYKWWVQSPYVIDNRSRSIVNSTRAKVTHPVHVIRFARARLLFLFCADLIWRTRSDSKKNIFTKEYLQKNKIETNFVHRLFK